VPFLDKVVFDVARTIPYDLKISHDTTKYALRRAMELIVPPHVINRKKLGFPVPIRHWLAGPELYDWARSIIEESRTEDIFNKAEVLAMLDEHRVSMNSGHGPDHSRRLWTVIAFMIWHGIFVENRIHPDIDEQDYPVQL